MAPIELSDSITIVRMAISIAWILVPGLVGAVLAGTGSPLTAYSFATLLSLGCFLSIITLMPHDHKPDKNAQSTKPSSLADLQRVISPGVFIRLIGTALITSVLHVNAIALPLIITGRGGGTVEDVGMVMGFVAGLEAILMLVWARIGRRKSQISIFFVASLLYAIYLVWLAFLTTRWEIYAASAIGDRRCCNREPANKLSAWYHSRSARPVGLPDRNQHVCRRWHRHSAFAIGTSFAGYGTVTIMGAIAGLAGVAILAKVEYKKN
ncbi:MFS transporter [Ochrobactrum pseudogrignonense]|nr:MFS transporter [Brucella pseudogrignonensis]